MKKWEASTFKWKHYTISRNYDGKGRWIVLESTNRVGVCFWKLTSAKEYADNRERNRRSEQLS